MLIGKLCLSVWTEVLQKAIEWRPPLTQLYKEINLIEAKIEGQLAIELTEYRSGKPKTETETGKLNGETELMWVVEKWTDLRTKRNIQLPTIYARFWRIARRIPALLNIEYLKRIKTDKKSIKSKFNEIINERNWEEHIPKWRDEWIKRQENVAERVRRQGQIVSREDLW